MKKPSIFNPVLIIVGTIVIFSGVRLPMNYPTLEHDHQQMILYMLLPIIAASILLVAVGLHVFYNRWWFKTLEIKIKAPKTLFQRIFTPLAGLSFLSLLITGLMMLCGWYPLHNHIRIWHFAIGIVWAFIVVCHGSLFARRKKPNTKMASI